MKLLKKELYRGHTIEIYARRMSREDVPSGAGQTNEVIRIDGVTQVRLGETGESAISEARRLVDEAEEETASLYR